MNISFAGETHFYSDPVMDRMIKTAVSTETASHGEEPISPHIGVTPDVLPEVINSLNIDNLQNGVSTRNILNRSFGSCPDVDEIVPRWYALRATYGKERDASEFINASGGRSYCPCIRNVRLVKGRRRKVEESYVPNLLFAYGSIEYLKRFVYDNANLPYLRFYEGMRDVCGIMQRRPLFVPERQMAYLRKICELECGGAFVSADKSVIFKVGDRVRIKEGSKFAGIEGRVARYKGQQCVGVVVNGLLTVATAYVPTYLLEKL